MISKRIARLTIGILLALLFIWLIAHQIHISEVKPIFLSAKISWIIAGLSAFFVDYACRIERWRLMLQRDNSQLNWNNCAGPLFASFAANNILPFRAGDALRAFAFNDRLGVTSGVVVATLFVERLLDLLMVVILLGVALSAFGINASDFAGIGGVALIAVALAVVVLLLFPRLFESLALFVGNMAMRLAPKFGKRVRDEISKSLETLVHLSKGGIMVRLLIWSLAVWLAEGCVFWFAALSISSIASPEAGWLALPVGTLATLIPSTPGYVGTFDYFVVRPMSVLGNTPSASTVYAILVHVLLWLPPTLIGGAYLLMHPVKNRRKSEAL